ncbi:hypothetical protein [Aquabacter spiritensis]|uniref:Uncharacterized protein n=1 Tax=Aquabacter spiritensis TaxID=933073 RepID=A0A4R3M4T2_9HYPH|nr:hypothetical protein [Aquabacter spiritensis]TCT08270.1 hypothetical protein EDC64_101793 [Aquabacter spiritensis]
MKRTGRAGSGHRLTVASATLFVGIQALATAAGGGWAIAGLLNLGDIGEYGLMVLLCVPALYATWRYGRSAARAEAAAAV